MAACSAGGSKLDGVYANANGQNTVEFRDGKAFVTMVGMASDAIPYDVKGNTITVHAGGIAGDLVLTRNSDGTLEGPFGIMRKKTCATVQVAASRRLSTFGGGGARRQAKRYTKLYLAYIVG